MFRIERSWDRIAYQLAERAELQAAEDPFAARGGRQPNRIPALKPVWSTFDVDADGRIWVQRYGAGIFVPGTPAERENRERRDNPIRQWRHPILYDVIEAGGRYLGTIRFPGHTTPPNDRVTIALARENLLWTVEKGEFDEQYVVRYRIEH